MSAITGIGEKRTIFASASASSIFGTAQRTTSQPAETSAAICAVVASTSCVFVSVIDWTTTGAPPPIVTSPTRICARLPIALKCRDMPIEPPPTPWALDAPARRPSPRRVGARCRPRARHAARAPTGSASSRCASTASSSGGRLRGAAVIPSTASAPSRSLRRAARGYEIRVDTAFADVIRGCADPAGRTAGSTTASSPRTRACTSSAGRTRSRPGTRTGSRGASTASRCGGLFAAESKFHRRSGASKARCSALVEHLAAAGGPTAARRPVGDAAPALARGRRDRAGRVPRAGSTRRSRCPTRSRRRRDRRSGCRLSPRATLRTAGRCRSSGRSRTAAARARSRRSRRARRPRARRSAR